MPRVLCALPVKGLLLFDPAPGILTAQRFEGDFGGSCVGVHWLVVARSAVAAADDGTDAAAADVDADADADAAAAVTFAYLYLYVSVYIHMYMYVYTYSYKCMHIYVYTYIQQHPQIQILIQFKSC